MQSNIDIFILTSLATQMKKLLSVKFISRVIESKNDKFPIGSLLVGYLGWRTHTVVNPDIRSKNFMEEITQLPELGSLCPSVGLGAVGMPG